MFQRCRQGIVGWFFLSRIRHTTVQGDWISVVFFFFQAEDGIRDYKVTGVQTWLFRSCRAAGPSDVPPPGRPGPAPANPGHTPFPSDRRSARPDGDAPPPEEGRPSLPRPSGKERDRKSVV